MYWPMNGVQPILVNVIMFGIVNRSDFLGKEGIDLLFSLFGWPCDGLGMVELNLNPVKDR